MHNTKHTNETGQSATAPKALATENLFGRYNGLKAELEALEDEITKRAFAVEGLEWALEPQAGGRIPAARYGIEVTEAQLGAEREALTLARKRKALVRGKLHRAEAKLERWLAKN